MTATPTNNAGRAAESRSYPRERVLFWSLLLLAILFLFTAFVARTYHKEVHVLADQWFAKGEASFQAGKIADALEDYRNALVYSPDNLRFQFHLAQALAAAGRGNEARAYLLNLLSEAPGSGEINLELARIAARQDAMPEALRYYHGAIYGVWSDDPIAIRWRVRRELCEYLLDHGDMNQAEAEIIALADNTPPNDLDGLRKAGNLLLRAGLWSRALSEFETALAAERHNPDALAGAGTAAFQLGQYPLVAQFFNRLPAEKRADPGIAESNAIARAVLSADPSFPGLSAEEKPARAAKALRQADSRIRGCVPQPNAAPAANPPQSEIQQALATLQATRIEWSERNLLRHPERIEAVMSFVFKVENIAAAHCGTPQGEDKVLWLLGRSRVGASQ